jgi:hypothetical protein
LFYENAEGQGPAERLDLRGDVTCVGRFVHARGIGRRRLRLRLVNASELPRIITVYSNIQPAEL